MKTAKRLFLRCQHSESGTPYQQHLSLLCTTTDRVKNNECSFLHRNEEKSEIRFGQPSKFDRLVHPATLHVT